MRQATPVDELEVHISMTPDRSHLTQLLYFCLSLQANGGRFARSKVVVHVASEGRPQDLRGMVPSLDRANLEWRWTDLRIVQKYGAAGASLQRLRQKFVTPWVLLMEPTMLVTGPLDDLLPKQAGDAPLVGRLALRPPTTAADTPANAAWWRDLLAAARLPAEASDACPAYLDMGALLAPAKVLNSIGEIVFCELAQVCAWVRPVNRAPLALALAMARLNVPAAVMPRRYNYHTALPATDGLGDAAYEASCVNYSLAGAIDAQRDFQSPAHVQALTDRLDLTGIDRVLQAHVQELQRRLQPSFVESSERRKFILAGLNMRDKVGMEIGPLDKPLVRRSDGTVLYVDQTDVATLRKKYARDPNVNESKIEVDAIWGKQTLQQALGEAKKVDYVIASHVVEHVPDLITWLQEIHAVLNAEGELRLAVPDRRFTFDYLRQESRLSDVLAAYVHRARSPMPHSIIDFTVNFAHVDFRAIWDKTFDPKKLVHKFTLEQALARARAALAGGPYDDVHCWVFTPRSFAALFEELGRHGLMQFECSQFHDTAYHSLEFMVTLRACDDINRVVASWQAMKEGVRPD